MFPNSKRVKLSESAECSSSPSQSPACPAASRKREFKSDETFDFFDYLKAVYLLDEIKEIHEIHPEEKELSTEVVQEKEQKEEKSKLIGDGVSQTGVCESAEDTLKIDEQKEEKSGCDGEGSCDDKRGNDGLDVDVQGEVQGEVQEEKKIVSECGESSERKFEGKEEGEKMESDFSQKGNLEMSEVGMEEDGPRNEVDSNIEGKSESISIDEDKMISDTDPQELSKDIPKVVSETMNEIIVNLPIEAASKKVQDELQNTCKENSETFHIPEMKIDQIETEISLAEESKVLESVKSPKPNKSLSEKVYSSKDIEMEIELLTLEDTQNKKPKLEETKLADQIENTQEIKSADQAENAQEIKSTDQAENTQETKSADQDQNSQETKTVDQIENVQVDKKEIENKNIQIDDENHQQAAIISSSENNIQISVDILIHSESQDKKESVEESKIQSQSQISIDQNPQEKECNFDEESSKIDTEEKKSERYSNTAEETKFGDSLLNCINKSKEEHKANLKLSLQRHPRKSCPKKFTGNFRDLKNNNKLSECNMKAKELEKQQLKKKANESDKKE